MTRREGQAWGGFLRAHAVLVRRLDAELRATHNLPLSSFDVLFQLALAPGGRLRLSELADRVVITQSGISRLVDRLEREGLVRRETDPEDRRSYHAVLTSEGEARLCRAQPTHVAGVRRYFLGHFPSAELATLGAGWRRVLAGATDAAALGERDSGSQADGERG
jgi:DNA-binding MarR family transcriptional regulator